MSKCECNAKWAIRDIDHGKTFFFDSWQDMVNFVLRQESF